MKRNGLILLAMLFGIIGGANAQGCPAGIPSAGNPGCIPPDQSNSPYYQSGSSNQAASAGRWEKRWGAFVLDKKVGLGVSKDMPSKQAAQSAAMEDCLRKGGMQCKTELVYSNQCGVIIEGDRTYNTARAATVEEATELGVSICNRSDKNCQVYFSDCSHAALVK